MMNETMKEVLLKIDELLNKEFKTDVPDNIRKIYSIIDEELDYIERMEIKWWTKCLEYN